jgi:hypothetical protein
MTKTAGAKVPFWILEHSNFEFVSSFGFRNSNLYHTFKARIRVNNFTPYRL